MTVLRRSVVGARRHLRPSDDPGRLHPAPPAGLTGVGDAVPLILERAKLVMVSGGLGGLDAEVPAPVAEGIGREAVGCRCRRLGIGPGRIGVGDLMGDVVDGVCGGGDFGAADGPDPADALERWPRRQAATVVVSGLGVWSNR